MSNDHVHPIFQPLLKGFEPKAKRHKAALGECALCDAEMKLIRSALAQSE